MRARFVAKLILHEGVLWLSCVEDCGSARSRLQRMIREGRVGEMGVIGGEPGMRVSLLRPPSDCLEVHVDATRGIVREVRVDAKTGAEETLATFFMDDFGEGLNPVRVTDDGGPPADVPP